ncbi:hypothetical protein HY967_04370 [Candidatus Jorgensenbacteria bacterium]|nr:hypothetical protein [Candidatus Jorgensenbacteria bacterium]
MKITAIVTSLLFFVLLNTTTVQSQKIDYLDTLKFSLEFSKFNSPNAFKKGFNWHATIAPKLRLLKIDAHELWMNGTLQTVLAERFDPVFRVSGEVFLIDLIYRYRIHPRWNLSTSLIHISTHITQDLNHPFYADLPPTPPHLLDDLNVLGFGLSVKSRPEDLPAIFTIRYQPVKIVFRETWQTENYERPLYLSAERALWRFPPCQISTVVSAELGEHTNSIVRTEMRFEVLKPEQRFGRAQFFAQHTDYIRDPIGSSPSFGFFRQGWALGFRIVYE